MAAHDFYEGVRAVLIDKGQTPRWRPPTLAEIDDEMIEAYFAPIGNRELDFAPDTGDSA
jgi:enoyl-CoA hydratase